MFYQWIAWISYRLHAGPFQKPILKTVNISAVLRYLHQLIFDTGPEPSKMYKKVKLDFALGSYQSNISVTSLSHISFLTYPLSAGRLWSKLCWDFHRCWWYWLWWRNSGRQWHCECCNRREHHHEHRNIYCDDDIHHNVGVLRCLSLMEDRHQWKTKSQ